MSEVDIIEMVLCVFVLGFNDLNVQTMAIVECLLKDNFE